MPQWAFKPETTASQPKTSVILGAVVRMAFVYVLMTYTVYGMKACASTQKPETVLAIGIVSFRANTLNFAIGCRLARLADAILLPIFPAKPSDDTLARTWMERLDEKLDACFPEIEYIPHDLATGEITEEKALKTQDDQEITKWVQAASNRFRYIRRTARELPLIGYR